MTWENMKKLDSAYDPYDWIKENSRQKKMCHYCGDHRPKIDEHYCSQECKAKDVSLGFDL